MLIVGLGLAYLIIGFRIVDKRLKRNNKMTARNFLAILFGWPILSIIAVLMALSSPFFNLFGSKSKEN